LVAELHAHVIFLTSDTSFSKSLPNPLFRTISLSSYPARIASASEVSEVSDSASEIWGLYIQPRTSSKTAWTPEQAWYLISALAETPALKYDEVLLDDLFREQGERALQHLEREELITIHSEIGAPATIVTGRQVDRDALKQLVNVDRLRLKMELQTYKARAKHEKERIAKKEEELKMLGSLRVAPKGREEYLLEKIERSHRRIEEWEGKIRNCRRGLNVERKEDREMRMGLGTWEGLARALRFW
jgi:hypothetical protein